MEKLILKGITHPGVLEIDEGLISVGRNPTNDFRVHDPTVSSFHCELIITANSILVRDLNSTNGTFIDGDPIQEALLKLGQVLRLGTAELRLEAQSASAAHPVVVIPPASAPIPAVPQATPDTKPPPAFACAHHPDLPAIVRCTNCGRTFCGECVRPLRLLGGQARLFCPSCSNPCEPIGLETPAAPQKVSLLGRLTQTIRIRRR